MPQSAHGFAWSYTNALRNAALARKAAETEVPAEPAPVAEPIKMRTKRTPRSITPAAGSQGDAG